MIDAFASIASRFPNTILRIAGDGDQKSAIEARIAAHSLQSRVQLLGKLPHREVMQEMIWSDLFALVGWDEPFATVYSEAASAGKAILCCNDGGFNDVLTPGLHGLTVPPRNSLAVSEALAQLLSDPSRLTDMGRAAGQLFEQRLHWDHHASVMESLFREALSASRSDRSSAA